MQALFEKVFHRDGVEPVLNWFSSTALTTRTQAAFYFSVYLHVRYYSGEHFNSYYFFMVY